MSGIFSSPEKQFCNCVKCKSTLYFEPHEVQSFIEHIYIGQATKKYFLICPKCDHKIVSILSWFPVGLCK